MGKLVLRFEITGVNSESLKNRGKIKKIRYKTEVKMQEPQIYFERSSFPTKLHRKSMDEEYWPIGSISKCT
jgi:hypothetical protein